MESLHAPWRIEYILAPKTAVAKASSPTSHSPVTMRRNLVIARDRTCYALLNRYPYNGGHLMVVPYRQTPDLNGLTDEELADLWKLVAALHQRAPTGDEADGFNIGINLGKVAGAGIAEHLHIHIVPRWIGDTNFMPVIAETTVVPQALTELAAKLRAALAQ